MFGGREREQGGGGGEREREREREEIMFKTSLLIFFILHCGTQYCILCFTGGGGGGGGGGGKKRGRGEKEMR